MQSLALSNLELVTVLRAAPLNGAPSSADYTDSQRETLEDLASIVDLLNTSVVPLLNSLAFPAGPISQVALTGDTVLASADPANSLFQDAVTREPLPIASVLTQLNAMITGQVKTIQALRANIVQLQTQLASTNQVDIAKAMQGFSDQIQALQAQLTTEVNAPPPVTFTTDPYVTISDNTALADGAYTTIATLLVSAAVVGNPVLVATSPVLPIGIFVSGRVVDVNSVRVDLLNLSGAPYTPGVLNYKVSVLQQ